jgi:hypothetical protein
MRLKKTIIQRKYTTLKSQISVQTLPIMKRYIILSLLLISQLADAQHTTTTTEHLRAQQAIHDVFQAFSDASIEKIQQVTTADVKILEHGEVWTLDSIRFYFNKPRPADFKRINTLEFFQTEVKGDMAFVSYWNTADIRSNNKDRKVKWLESAVLVMEGGRWRVRMLHSTRVQY